MKDIKKEFSYIWAESGGLIPINLAAKITGISQPEISRKVKNGQLEEYHVDGYKSSMVSLPEVMKLERTRKAPRRKKTEQ